MLPLLSWILVYLAKSSAASRTYLWLTNVIAAINVSRRPALTECLGATFSVPRSRCASAFVLFIAPASLPIEHLIKEYPSYIFSFSTVPPFFSFFLLSILLFSYCEPRLYTDIHTHSRTRFLALLSFSNKVIIRNSSRSKQKKKKSG